MPRYIAAIDQGTTSTRCLLLDERAHIAAAAQREHQQIYPRPGWVEHDAEEIHLATCRVIEQAIVESSVRPGEIVAVGITNQRETVVAWDRRTGKPLHHAIVWQDTRTQSLCDALAAEAGPNRFREQTGLPIATYFSGPKMRWLIENHRAVFDAAERGHLMLGTIDAWLVYKLTGGAQRGVHVTDPTNACRTMLMNLHTLQWDHDLCGTIGVPRDALPAIHPSSEPASYGTTTPNGPFEAELPITGILGDQQAALVGQACFEPGQIKNTYGTGCFLLQHTGETPVQSRAGLLSTVAYQFADRPPAYALEGSIAITGALVQWLRDNLGLIGSSAEVEALAGTVHDNGGVYIVPAFSGLFAPHWRADARGVIAGLTRYANKAHIARAALEATAYQTRDVVLAMRADCGQSPPQLRVDGGMTANALLMQFQADVLDLPVVRPRITETTALGAAYAAGLAVGFWSSTDELAALNPPDHTWRPAMEDATRKRLCIGWAKAVERSLGWEDVG